MLKLLLPILFPSWRFFSSIGPSPRIELAFVVEKNAEPQVWLPFRPLPERLGFAAGVWRLLHNPDWNERLYINSCAEHLFAGPDDFYVQEIAGRLLNAVRNREMTVDDNCRYLLFRIRALELEVGQLRDERVFVSRPFLLHRAGHKS